MTYPYIALDTITSTQDQKEVTANNMAEAESPAALFGCRPSTTTGLTFGYYGGVMIVDGVVTAISSGTVLLTTATTNYVESTTAGVVSTNTTSFTAGRIPLYTIVTGASTISTVTPARGHLFLGHETQGMLTKALSDANTTLTAAEARPLQLTFSGTLTATRNVVLPLTKRIWYVYNGTNQSLQFIGASGTGITVATTKRAIVAADGTNIVRYGADV
jgi:hypothetical protein